MLLRVEQKFDLELTDLTYCHLSLVFWFLIINNDFIYKQITLRAFSHLKYSLLVVCYFPSCCSVSTQSMSFVFPPGITCTHACVLVFIILSQTFMFRPRQLSMNCVFSCSLRSFFEKWLSFPVVVRKAIKPRRI